ncbi:hypothetical protein EUX98_g2490 [Antrodiella citrinella]|uniref:F-box domain-containing protein n=1 Tax=Antrodiella citrinella TaxID=2447956 RepID=A0A4S4MYV0_9APHY|nr:hypothetical protein EUX98_g2490 [Antrodiella citrinella]
MTSKSQADIAMPALRQLLPALPNLTTIQVLHCNKAGDVGAAVIGLRLPSVRTVIVPTKCNCILKACPNVTHVRCAGGDGAALISALKFCDDVQILDGMIDWSYKDIMTRLLKNAPKLHTLEIRRPVKSFRFETRITAPAIWAEVIPQLSKLPELRTIKLSFPGRETSSDSASIEAARKVLRNSRVTRERKLIIRRVFAPHNTNSQWEDVVEDYRQELFY